MELAQARELWQPEPGWLNTASYGLPPEPVWTAVQEALADWRVGRTSHEVWEEATGRSREAFAGLVGVPVTDVAVGVGVSQLLGPIAAALPAAARSTPPAGGAGLLAQRWGGPGDWIIWCRDELVRSIRWGGDPGSKEVVVDPEVGVAPGAAVPGYRIAGKTGTAQRVGPECRCYDGTFTVSFAGFAPADDPQVAVAVVVEDGGGQGQSGSGNTIAAPIAKKVMEAVLGR